MAKCPKCGNEISEEMAFCPKCGTSLKVAQPTTEARTTVTYRRDEKSEKREKDEKEEKGEKHEKREYSFIGPLIGGLILVCIGLVGYLQVTQGFDPRTVWAIFFVIIGVIIIGGAVYGAMLAGRRHPRT